MPVNIKIIVSFLVILVAAAFSYFEHRTGSGGIKWFVISLGLFMALSLWLFPEPRKDKSKKVS